MENLSIYSARILGAKQLLNIFKDWGINLFPDFKKEGKIYSKALYECLLDTREMENFLLGGQIEFHSHERKNDKLVSCKAHIK